MTGKSNRLKAISGATVPSNLDRTTDGERLIALFTQLTGPLSETFPTSTEVVLHDLSRLPHSIIAIHGELSGRKVGDPPLARLLDNVMGLAGDHVVGFKAALSDGRRIRSTTLIIRDVAGTAVAALCINADLSAWDGMQRLLDEVSGKSALELQEESTGVFQAGGKAQNPGETACDQIEQNVHALATTLIENAIREVEIPAELMHKCHKLAVVRDLKSRGIFQLRDGVTMVATSLLVTRFTIYNYLNQLSEGDPGSDTDTELEI